MFLLLHVLSNANRHLLTDSNIEEKHAYFTLQISLADKRQFVMPILSYPLNCTLKKKNHHIRVGMGEN